MKIQSRSKPNSLRLFRTAILLFLLLLGQQASTQTFERTYGDPGIPEGGQCMLPLNDDTLVLGGYRGDSALLMFVDPDGDLLFDRTFKATTGNRRDIVCHIRQDSDGMIYGTGTARNVFPLRGFAFRYDYQSDNLIWVREFIDPDSATTHTVGNNILEQNPGGDFFIFGQISSGSDDAYMVSVNRNTGALTTLVNSVYPLGSSQTFSSTVMVPTPGNQPRIFSTGRFSIAGVNGMRASIAELRPDGAVINSRSYYVPATQNARQYSTSIVYDGEDLAIAGRGDRNGISTVNTTCNLSQHRLNLGMIWGNEYLFPNYTTEGFEEVILANGGYVTLGRDGNSQTLFLMQTDPNGNVLWSYEYGDLNQYYYPYAGENQVIAYNGSLYMLAEVPEANDPDSRDVVLFRINADGTMSDDCRFEPLEPSVVPYQADYPNNLSPVPSTNQMVAVNSPLNDPVLDDFTVCGQICFAESDSSYENITAPITISSDEAWTGKFYVAEGVIITVDAATLDLTQVDMVFEECAGIDFINGAKLRANNSVFRTCDERLSWRGLHFAQESGGVIHESTFKNAQRAIWVSNALPNNSALLRISSNHFVNNQWAINIGRTRLSDAITGNQFLITNAEIDYQPDSCQNIPPTTDFIGIRAFSVQFEGPIAQNSFINTSQSPGNKVFRGMFMHRSSGTVSSNTFTNNYSALELSASYSCNLENSRIELTNGYLGNQSQIRVSGSSSSINITGNHLVNANEQDTSFLTNNGIYAEDGSLINIKENHVEGFSNGIKVDNILNSSIGENQVSNFDQVGIQIEDGNRLDITCNEVNARFTASANTIGIRYRKNNALPQQIRIQNNCVFNTSTAVHLSTSSPTNLPLFTNNYLYNYRRNGVFNSGFTGGIGTSIPSFATSGRNTFTSNNIPNGALDINSVPAIVAAGNYGLSSISGVTVLGNGLYHSTAACGHQMGNVNQQLTADEACDQFTTGANQRLSDLTQSPAHILDILDKDQTTASNYLLAQAWLAKMHHEAFYDQELEMLTHLLTSLQLDHDGKALLQYEFHARRGAPSESAAALASVSNLSPEYRTQKVLYELDEALVLSGRSITELTDTEINLLRSISDKATAAGDNAWDYLHLAIGDHPFRYPTVNLPDEEMPTERILLEEGNFSIFPNPTKGHLNLEYYLEQTDGAHLQIYDLQGRLLMDKALEANAQRMELDLSHLKAGVYFVSLLDQNGRLSRKKLVKI